MSDTQFDNFFNDKLSDHEASVPPGLWDKLKDSQFDQFIGDKLKDGIAPVPGGLWDKISDGQFDEFIGGKLLNHTAPVPSGLWDKVSDKQFDGFIADKLYNHIAPVPEGLWEKIKPEEKDRKIGFIFFRYPAAAILILTLLLGGAIGSYFYLRNDHADAGADNNGSHSLHTPANGATPEQIVPEKSESTNGSLSRQNNAGHNQSVPGNQGTTSTTSNANQPDQKANLLSSPPEKGNQLPDNKTDNNASASESSSVTVNGLRIRKGGKGTNNFLNTLPSDKNIPDQSLVLDYDNLPAKNQSLSNRLSENHSNQENDFEFIEPYSFNKLMGAPVPFHADHANAAFSLSDKKIATANHTSQFRNVIICPSDHKNRNTDWFLEAYASPDLVFKSVTNKTASQQYLLTKDSAESMQVSYSAGLRLVKPITDNFLVKVGMQYAQANQKYVYRTENEVKTITVVSVRTIIRAPGDTVVVKDTSTLQQVGFKNNTVKNRYRSFDIPVTVGYQFGDEDTKFGINAGVVVNLSSWYQGSMLDTSLATVTLNKNGNGVFKTNIGVGLIASFSIVKKLSDDLHVFAEPYFRYNLSGMTTQQAGFNQRFSVGGLALGLRLNLNRK